MDILHHDITISIGEQVGEQVLSFFEGVTFLGSSKPVTVLLIEQVERLEAVQKETPNAFRAAAIEYITELFFEETGGRRPSYEVLNRLGNVMDADFIFAQYKPEEEYSSVTERQLKTRMSRESSAQSGYYTAADGQCYKPSTRYRGKSALD